MNKHSISRSCPMKIVCNCLHDGQCVGQQAANANSNYIPFSHFTAHAESKRRTAIMDTWLAAIAGITLCSAMMIGLISVLPTGMA